MAELCAYCSSRESQKNSLSCRQCEIIRNPKSSEHSIPCEYCGNSIPKSEEMYMGIVKVAGLGGQYKRRTEWKRSVCRECTPKVRDKMQELFKEQ